MNTSPEFREFFSRDRVQRLRDQQRLLEQQVAGAADAADAALKVVQDLAEIMRNGSPSDQVAAALALPYVREDLGRATGKGEKLRRELQEIRNQTQIWETLNRMVQP